jgi:peptide deformylase
MAKPELSRAAVPAAPRSGAHHVAVRRVLAHPHPLLSARAFEVDPQDPRVVALARSLVVTMRASPACVGLAATQVGEPARVFCMDVTGHRRARSCAGLVVLVNPHIVEQSEEVLMREGCLSVPHATGAIARPAEVVVEGLEPGTGHVVRVTADQIEARCILHEIDHLDGYVFLDRARDPARDLYKRRTYA